MIVPCAWLKNVVFIQSGLGNLCFFFILLNSEVTTTIKEVLFKLKYSVAQAYCSFPLFLDRCVRLCATCSLCSHSV